jgi:hypothetical protein
MKTYFGLILVCAVLHCGGAITQAQNANGEFHLKRKSGYEITVSLRVADGKTQQISYSEWTPINRSGHECGMDASRNDGTSKWTEHGSTLTVTTDDDSSTISITTRADGLLIQSRCNDLKILFSRQADKYVGRVLR